MEKTTFFKDKKSNISSIRVTNKVGNSSLSFTRYMDGSAGGMTIKGPHITTRFNKNGMVIGSAIKSGNKTTYFGKHGNVTNHITSFK